MKKKNGLISAVCIAAAVLLCGCSGGHTHSYSEEWDVDLNGHRHFCTECDKAKDEGKHKLDDTDTCTVCGAQIADFDDGKSLYLFNESGDPLKTAEYDKNGKLVTETVCKYEYNGDGLLIASTVTTDGVITEENEYTTVDGESVQSKCTSYMEDGSKSVSTYDENGNIIKSVSYASDGNVIQQSDSEFKETADGEWYESKCTTVEEDGTKTVGVFAENGDQLGLDFYNADGSLESSEKWEYTYGKDGNKKTSKHYLNNTLTKESVYATAVNGDESVTYPETVTEYDEDGGKTVTVYNENDEVLKKTQYGSNGKVIS